MSPLVGTSESVGTREPEWGNEVKGGPLGKLSFDQLAGRDTAKRGEIRDTGESLSGWERLGDKKTPSKPMAGHGPGVLRQKETR